MKFKLTRNEKRNLSRFVKRTKEKMEYARASTILMRSKGMKVKQVASSLQVCMGAVFKWERLYRRNGLDGLRSRKPPCKLARKRPAAKRLIPMLLKRDPKAFGFLKGRWVVRDIAKVLKGEGVEISPTQVHGILRDLGLSYKRPKLDVVSYDPSYARKEREVRSYKQIALPSQKMGHSRI